MEEGQPGGAVLDDEAPTLLALDNYSLLHVAHFLTSPRDLAAFQQTCTLLHRLLQPSSSWSRVLKLQYGIQLRPSASLARSAANGQPGGPELPHNKSLLRLLRGPARDLHSVRFTAVYTDGGVDVGSLHYWADHMFIPNAWAPYCAKYANNINCLAVLKIGTGAYPELAHRNVLIRSLKYVVPLLQQGVPPQPSQPPPDPRRVEAAADLLSHWRTLRLESFFCQMAARLAIPDHLGLALLTGLAGTPEERRAWVLALAASLEERAYYDRVYRLHFMPRRPQPLASPLQARGQGGLLRLHPQRQPAGGEGVAALGRNGAREAVVDRPYVMDECAVREELMTGNPASCVAVLTALSVSREGRLSCPVQCGVLLAGLLPPGWPQVATAATTASAPASAEAAGTSTGPAGNAAAAAAGGVLDPQLASYDAFLRSALEQRGVTALDDKQDAGSVFAACAAGQLPPWVRHVVLDHAEYIELLPPHLEPEGSAAAAAAAAAGAATCGSSGSGTGEGGGGTGDAAAAALRSAVPRLHPVVWFRFKDHADYSRRHPSRRTRHRLRGVAEACRGVAAQLARELDRVAEVLGREVDGLCRGTRSGVPDSADEGEESSDEALQVEAGEALQAEETGAPAAGAATSAAAAAASEQSSSGAMDSGSKSDSGQAEADTAGQGGSQPSAPERSVPVMSVLDMALTIVDSLRSQAMQATEMVQELLEADLDMELPAMELQSVVDVAAELHDAVAAAANDRDALVLAHMIIIGCATGWEEVEEEEEEEVPSGLRGEVGAAGQSLRENNRRRAWELLTDPRTASEGPERNVVREAARAAAETAEQMYPEGDVAGRSSVWRGLCEQAGAKMRQTLAAPVFSEEARLCRRALAASLRRLAAPLQAAANARPPVAAVQETRNEELLRRLSVSVPEPPVAAVAAAAAPATAAPPPPPGDGEAIGAGAPALAAAGGGADAAGVAGGAAAAVTLEPPPPVGWEAEGVFDPALQSNADDGATGLWEQMDGDEAHRVVHLVAPLLFPVAANMVLFKAVRPENLMGLVGWDDHEQPNVDIQYVGLQGRVVRLPPGVQAVPTV